MKLILLAIIFFFVFTSLWGFYTSIRPPKINANLTPPDLDLEYEKVEFTTVDDITLRGWFIPRQNKNDTLPPTESPKTIILLHGYPAEKGDILPSLAFLNDRYNLFLFDFRYLGQSEGKYTTAGAKETKDLLAAIRYLKSRGINEVGVWGFSLGGAVALMAAPEAPEIKAMVSEASYARLDLMAPELYRLPILGHPLAWLTRLWGMVFLQIDIKKASPMDAAAKLHIPILIIHSTNDNVIPFSHALLIQKALAGNPNAEFWFRENLFHGQLGEEYREKILEFFGKNL